MKKADNYIFVSYARANSDRVIPIIEDLKKNGYNVWYDREISVGTEWPDFLENQILNCSCFLVFISKAAVDSINVRNEINFAITQNKNIFVISSCRFFICSCHYLTQITIFDMIKKVRR